MGNAGVLEHTQPIGCRAGRHDFGGRAVGQVNVADAIGQGTKSLVGRELGSSDHLTEFDPMGIEVRQYRDVTIERLIRLAVFAHQPRVARLALGRLESHTPEVLGHDEVDHRLEHRHFELLALPGAFTMEQCREHTINHRNSSGFISDDRRQIARFTEHHFIEHGDTARRLD